MCSVIPFHDRPQQQPGYNPHVHDNLHDQEEWEERMWEEQCEEDGITDPWCEGELEALMEDEYRLHLQAAKWKS